MGGPVLHSALDGYTTGEVSISFELPSVLPQDREREWPPETSPDPDGPGRDKGVRPPTTGMLPPRGQPERDHQVVLLATDHPQDTVYLRAALWHASQQDSPAPTLVRCDIREASGRVRALEPTIIVIGDHTGMHWGAEPLALCRLLKHSVAVEIPVVMRYHGRRMFGRRALHAAAPDAVVPASTCESLFFFQVYLQIAKGAGPECW